MVASAEMEKMAHVVTLIRHQGEFKREREKEHVLNKTCTVYT